MAYGGDIIVPLPPEQRTEGFIADPISLFLPTRRMVGGVEPHLEDVRDENAFLVYCSTENRFLVSGDAQVDVGFSRPLLGNAEPLYQFSFNALDLKHWRNSVHET